MLHTTFLSVPESLIEWVRHSSVLTEKLKQTHSSVELQVLSHGLVWSNNWERQMLGIKPELILRREVLILGDNKPCWLARTLVPFTTYQYDKTFFDRLIQEPLSHLIYNEPRVCRNLIHSYGIDAKNIEYHWVTPRFQKEANLWMRLSSFYLDEMHPFYLAELFLP